MPTFRLTCSFLQFHASGASRPFSARCAKAGKTGSSSCGSISSLIINLSPCISCGGSWAGTGFCPCRDVSSSNHVGRMDLCPSSPGCFVDFTVSRWILWNIGGTIHAGMKAVIYWMFHITCKDCEVESGVIHLTCPSTTLMLSLLILGRFHGTSTVFGA